MRYLALFFCLTIISCYKTKQKDCSNFKTGTFKYENPYYKDWIIIRNDSIQIEYNTNDNSKIIGHIEWTSDCTYQFTYHQVDDTYTNSIIGTKLKVNIIESSNNSYKYQTYLNKLKDEYWITKISDKKKLQ